MYIWYKFEKNIKVLSNIFVVLQQMVVVLMSFAGQRLKHIYDIHLNNFDQDWTEVAKYLVHTESLTVYTFEYVVDSWTGLLSSFSEQDYKKK